MGEAISRTVTVKPGGRIELDALDLPAGSVAEVLVMPALSAEDRAQRLLLAAEFDALCQRTRWTSSIDSMTDEEIAAEIAAARAEMREGRR